MYPPHGPEASIKIQKSKSPVFIWIAVSCRPPGPPNQEPLDSSAVHGGHVALNDPRSCQADVIKYFNLFSLLFPENPRQPFFHETSRKYAPPYPGRSQFCLQKHLPSPLSALQIRHTLTGSPDPQSPCP